MGLNISKVSENALKEMIARIERPVSPKNREDWSDAGSHASLVGPPGFEPGSRAPEAQSLDHASRRPLSSIFHATSLHKDSLRILIPRSLNVLTFWCKAFSEKLLFSTFCCYQVPNRKIVESVGGLDAGERKIRNSTLIF